MTAGDLGSAARFVLAALAAWRIAHLLAEEDGPFDAVARLRALLGRTIHGEAMDCFDCVSLWVAAPFALFVIPYSGRASLVPILVCWLALAGAAALLEHATRRRDPEPIVIETLAEAAEEEPAHGLLQSTTGGDVRLAPDIAASALRRAH